MAAQCPEEHVQAILRLARAGYQNPADIRRRLAGVGIKIGRKTISDHVRRWRWESAGETAARKQVSAPETEAVPETREVERKLEGDTARVEWVTAEHVRTEEDLVRVCKVDTTRWRIKKMTVKAYQTGMKLATREQTTGGATRVMQETPTVVQLFSVAAELERVLPVRELDAVEALFARLGDGARQYAIPPRVRRSLPSLVADIDLFDCHFANLSWAPESGEHDDLRIKEGVYANAIDDILDRTEPYPITEAIFPVGNDLHHVDTLLRTTTAGTPQDTDGRYAKMIEVTQAAVIRGVERILAMPSIEKVKVIYVPGNHDKLTSYHLCLALAAWFRHCKMVEVDSTFCIRKYLHYGRCLMGYTHGDRMPDGKLKDLPSIMAHERRDIWSQATCCEWKTGHVHTSQTFTTLSSKEFHGVVIRRLRSLTGPNAWHFDNLFVGNARGAEAYLYDPNAGYVGHFVAPART